MIVLDFTEAFDTVQHSTPLDKLAKLISGEVYNWIKDLLHGRSHCTKFAGSVSTFINIYASINQRPHNHQLSNHCTYLFAEAFWSITVFSPHRPMVFCEVINPEWGEGIDLRKEYLNFLKK